ncbi:2-polyprenyl-6-methoxyphenol hydroxylase [Chitinophaga ginsengisegetis]|uniref:2-polyprenyl-6-methoxyphenol hydroxylase n=1 Tax=Chitinophaga ginsengisegetis TaxID=393003 RepID=A0A1T5PCD1_9BACT|nr:FAD-dependent monooxygenase [Chitinophaga ginsengisegetis]SKD09919.1 2-polyprenyl-6-methoxyphenol hydroxylase [Chitinophaga ginsengisegetis]
MELLSNNKVIIIGGGIAGSSMALFLKKIGIASAIFEANETTFSNGAGLNLAPNGVSVLAELGLAAKAIESGSIAVDGIFKNAKGKKLAKVGFSNAAKYKYPSVNIKRATLADMMHDELVKQNIPVYFSKKLQSISQTENEVTATFEDGTQATGRILIGADGVRSIVRNYVLDTPMKPGFTGVVGGGGFVDKNKIQNLTPSDSNNINFIYGKNGFIGYTGVNKNELMWWTNIMVANPYTREEQINFNKEAERKSLLNQYAAYSSPITDIINNSSDFIRLNVFDIQFLPRWFKKNCILIGDAAHAVSPNSGQGASMALEDAMLLAKLIRDEKELDTAFSTFEKMRRPRVEKIVLEGRKRGSDKVIVSAFQQKIRELMIRIFVNAFAEKSNHWLFDYKIEW